MEHAWGRREGGRKNILKFDTRVHMQFKVVLSFEEVTEDCSYSNLKLCMDIIICMPGDILAPPHF